MGHDNLIALVAATVVGAGIMMGWTYLSKRTSEYRQSVATLTAQVDKLQFPISCTPEGRLDNLNQRNCVERNGYRIVRSGLDAIVVKMDKDEPVVVYHSSPDRRRIVPGNREEIIAITRVFSDEQPLD
ncbi:hypothetical protein [Rhizobium sp. MHM7A]|uniref:hypothetical protein n=1 Tax=Rhizobium sp. MHM7A TaxID=2583233 RepID=UPI0011071FE5|nr:hypothetical protein [Rhizobium sp. MHM7A]TLX16226.1 hypothetical protein FFR93_02545 [Rhizobium sp. MHM7A]